MLMTSDKFFLIYIFLTILIVLLVIYHVYINAFRNFTHHRKSFMVCNEQTTPLYDL